MAASDRKSIRRHAAALLTGVVVFGSIAFAPAVQAQNLTDGVADDSKLLLTANELLYNKDAERVTATGVVRMRYSGYSMVAQQVEYDQKSGRVIARGDIELIEPDGNRIYAQEMDVTDDFAQGFVNALRVETTDNTRLAAESAERESEDVMILNNGVYTACLPCAQKPGKAPLWQVKAERVVQNGKTHTVRLEKARFELFGMPIAYLPFIEVPDQTVKRKSGFLFPRMSITDNLGFGVTVPYFHVLSKTSDVTISPTLYTSQGLLLEAEIRQRFESGQHTFRMAGISQRNKDSFTAGSSDQLHEQRGMVASKGEFTINPRWAFGWDVMLQSDNNFAKTYELSGLDNEVRTNQIYLTGLGKRNSFDMRGYYFDVQDNDDNSLAEQRQAYVHPVIDYTWFAPESVAGGELRVTSNFTSLTRLKDHFYTVGTSNRYGGLDGTYTRLSSEAEWKRSFNTPQGLVLTPLLALRGDTSWNDMLAPSAYSGDFRSGDATVRGMVTAGLEARYPVLITDGNSSHVIEPIAQIFVRPNEQYAGGLPNEDAQDFNFDATSLFERDKFTGFDRIEGGTRANVGFRYTGSFNNGLALRGIFGQSYHIAGDNSFASPDLLNVGANSGLETDVSDFVAMAAVDLPNGVSISNSVRLDKDDLEIRRNDTTVSYRNRRFSGELGYARVTAQPDYGFDKDRDIVHGKGHLRFDDNWSLFGSMTYDINAKTANKRSIGIAYQDECTILTVSYTDEGNSTSKSANDWSVSARLSFRTLGDISVGSGDTATDEVNFESWTPLK